MEVYFKTAHKSEIQEVTPQITSLATQKLNNLKKYLGKYKEAARVFVELGKESDAHQNGNIWRITINLDSGGKRYNAVGTAEKPEAALATTIHELEQELRKAKIRRHAMLRKGGGILKGLMRGFRPQ